VLRDVALEHAKTLARIWRRITSTITTSTLTARTSPLCGWCAFAPACPAKTSALLPKVGSSEHDELLRDLGLRQRVRDAVADALERADQPGDEKGPR
jgi:hypothetical protein